MAMQHGRVVLPPNLAENTLKRLQRELPKLIVLADELPKNLETAETSERASKTEKNQTTTHISALQIDELIQTVKQQERAFERSTLLTTFNAIQDAEIWLYTSGSTGEPKKIIKTWQQMIHSAGLAIDRFELMQPCYLVGTVPSQHMFGLETTIFWPLFSNATLWHAHPIFPEDIIAALLQNSAVPAFLVSTPLHLKKLLAFNLQWPNHLTRLLSATAPLSQTLAETLEHTLSAEVNEVYGSTETASIASRQPSKSEIWHAYDTVTFTLQADERYAVKLPGLVGYQPLNDRLELLDPSHFKLGKRDSDLIKVAGKRVSLTELNQHLHAIPGMVEGVFVQSESTERLTAFVVTLLTPSDILAALRQSIDPLFLPRPIIYLDALPRSELGKILYNELACQLVP